MFLVNTKKALKVFDKVYVSSDSQWILDQAQAVGAIPIWRSQKLCGDMPNIPVYQHALRKMGDVTGIVAIQANSPTVDLNLIVMVKKLMEMGAKEIMTCYDDYSIYGSIWSLTKDKLLNYGDPYKPKPEILLKDRSVDIHTFEDLEEAIVQSNVR